MVNVHGREQDLVAHIGLDAETTCSALRHTVEGNSGLDLPYWSDFTGFPFDYTES